MSELLGCRHGFVTDLVLRCGRGDAAALARLFDLFWLPVSTAVAARVPAGRVEAEVTEVFVRVWREAPHYRPGADDGAVGWVMAFAYGATARAPARTSRATGRRPSRAARVLGPS